MACFGTRLKTINDCGLLIEELTVLRDNRPARIHALWREKWKHPWVLSQSAFPGVIPGYSGWPNHSQMSFLLSSQDRLLSLVGTWLLPAATHCTAVYPAPGGIFLCYPFASTFHYSELRLQWQLGSKDSTKAKTASKWPSWKLWRGTMGEVNRTSLLSPALPRVLLQ